VKRSSQRTDTPDFPAVNGENANERDFNEWWEGASLGGRSRVMRGGAQRQGAVVADGVWRRDVWAVSAAGAGQEQTGFSHR
jgi:hypothetical protein